MVVEGEAEEGLRIVSCPFATLGPLLIPPAAPGGGGGGGGGGGAGIVSVPNGGWVKLQDSRSGQLDADQQQIEAEE